MNTISEDFDFYYMGLQEYRRRTKFAEEKRFETIHK